MTTLLSPGIEIVEKDLSAYISRAATGRGATVGKFQWGPCFSIQQVSDEADIVNRFGLPDDYTYHSFYSATNFLKYANDLRLVRICDSREVDDSGTARNSAVANTISFDVVNGGTGYAAADAVMLAYSVPFTRTGTVATIKLNNHLLSNHDTITVIVSNDITAIALDDYSVDVIDANTFTIECDNAGATSGTLTIVLFNSQIGSVSTVNVGVITAVTATPNYLTNIRPAPVGAVVISTAGANAVIDYSYDSTIEVFFPNDANAMSEIASTPVSNYVPDYHSVYGRYPGQYGDDITVAIINKADFDNKNIKSIMVYGKDSISTNGVASNKYVSISRGSFGNNVPTKNTQYAVLVYYKDELVENFVVSTENGDKDIYGRSMYVNDVFEKGSSSYIMAAAGDVYHWSTKSAAYRLTGGNDSSAATGDWIDGWDLFDDPDVLYVNLLFAGGACGESAANSSVIQKHIIENIAGVRRDCLVFVSPAIETTTALKPAAAVSAALEFHAGLAVSSSTASFATMDAGQHKQQLDKYNDRKVWISNNADIAGLCAFTDRVAYTWNSPAGLNRGSLKGVIKLAYDAKQAYRDTLYEAQMNPIVHFPSEGYCLWGDKTMQSKPSAFDRINVRRLFNMLEKAIGDAAKYKLFENNTAFTRNSFVTEVSAYLDIIKGQGGVVDYYVWCDERNNTPAVIDRNEFIGTIFIKPPRSINYLTLNFVATSTGANFEELISQQF